LKGSAGSFWRHMGFRRFWVQVAHKNYFRRHPN
jgi:hypothetical protein